MLGLRPGVPLSVQVPFDTRSESDSLLVRFLQEKYFHPFGAYGRRKCIIFVTRVSQPAGKGPGRLAERIAGTGADLITHAPWARPRIELKLVWGEFSHLRSRTTEERANRVKRNRTRLDHR